MIKLSILSKSCKDMRIENAIYNYCAPYISRKILTEVYRSQQEKVVVTQLNESLFQVSSKDPNVKEYKRLRIVNMDQRSCSCKRIYSFGFPCCHILAVLSSQNHLDLIELIPSFIKIRWKYNSVPTKNESHQSISYLSPNAYIDNFQNSACRSKTRKELAPNTKTFTPHGKSALKKPKFDPNPSSTASRNLAVDAIQVNLQHHAIEFIKWKITVALTMSFY